MSANAKTLNLVDALFWLAAVVVIFTLVSIWQGHSAKKAMSKLDARISALEKAQAPVVAPVPVKAEAPVAAPAAVKVEAAPAPAVVAPVKAEASVAPAKAEAAPKTSTATPRP